MTTIQQHHKHVKRQRSEKQIKRQKSFQICKNIWIKLPNSAKNTWKSFAINRETNYQAFMRCNIVRVYNDVEAVKTPDPSWL